jgi:hypothetical protein
MAQDDTPVKRRKPQKITEENIPPPFLKKPDSVGKSIFFIAMSIITILVIAFISWKWHTTCGNEWLVAIVKSIGLQCLSALILIAIGSPFLYWAKSSLERDLNAGKLKDNYISYNIGWNIMPWSNVGMVIQQVLVALLFWYFSKECVATAMNGGYY